MAGKDFIGYPKLLDKAYRGLVREILAQAAKQGLMGSHHFFITFDTRAQGVSMSDDLRARYPVEMTIVLQHKFWGLKVEDDKFEVTLTFNKIPEELVVPFHAVRRFTDPSQEFGFALQAISPEPQGALAAFKPLSAPPKAEPVKDPAPLAPAASPNPIIDPPTQDEPAAPAGPTVVSLDAFRKK
jgi:hypothetical protein